MDDAAGEEELDPLEKPRLDAGVVPITCTTPIIMPHLPRTLWPRCQHVQDDSTTNQLVSFTTQETHHG